ncbi:MAG: hypothetical protein ABIS07_10725 [Dokdonella sp.]
MRHGFNFAGFNFARMALIALIASVGTQANASGSIDASFGSGGIQRVSGEGAYGPTSMVVMQGGRIAYAAGRPGSAQLLVGILRPDGQPDSNFAGDGLLTLSSTGSLSAPFIAEDPANHAIVLVATELLGGIYHMRICRILDTGSLDNTFTLSGYAGQSGCVRTDSPPGAPNGLTPAGVIVDSNGSIDVGGTAYDFSDPTIQFKVFAAAIVPGGAVITTVNFVGGYNVVINAMAMNPLSNSMLLTGSTQLPNGSDTDTAIILVRASTVVVWNNRVLNVNAGYDEGRGVAIKFDGNIIVAGVADVSGSSRTQCVVYETDANLNPVINFGQSGGGLATNFTGVNIDSARCDAVVVDSQRRAYISGAVLHGTGEFDMAIGRLTDTGTFDALLYGDQAPGYSVLGPDDSPNVHNERVFAVGLQNGRAIIAGPSEPFTGATLANTDMLFLRLDEYDYLFANGME